MRQRVISRHGTQASGAAGQVRRAVFVLALLFVTAGPGAISARADDALTPEAEGDVSIGAPDAALVIDATGLDVRLPMRFGKNYGQLLSMWDAQLGLGVQDYTLYLRSPRNFAWFQGGAHVDKELGPGETGKLLMSLSSQPEANKGTLHVNGSLTAASVSVGEKDIVTMITELQTQIETLRSEVRALKSSHAISIGQDLRMVRGNYTRSEEGTLWGYGPAAFGGHEIKLVRTGVFDIIFYPEFSGMPVASLTPIFPHHKEGDSYTGGDPRDNAVIVEISPKKMRIKTGDSMGNDATRSFSFIVVGPK